MIRSSWDAADGGWNVVPGAVFEIRLIERIFTCIECARDNPYRWHVVFSDDPSTVESFWFPVMSDTAFTRRILRRIV